MCKAILKINKIEEMGCNNFIIASDRFGISYKFYNNDNLELHTNDYIEVETRTADYKNFKVGIAEVILRYMDIEKLQVVNNHLVKADGTKASDYISKETINFITRESKEEINKHIAELENLLNMSYEEYLKYINTTYKNFKENEKSESIFEEEKESYKIRIAEKKNQLEMLEKYLKVA